MEFDVKDEKDKFELMKKMVEFQKNVKQPKKDKNNPFSKSSYASLQSVQETVVEALEPLGLSFFQDFGINNEGKTLSVQTVIISDLGMIKFNPIVLPLEKITAQGVGSASTYARRYALTTNLAIVADEDDDGNNASYTNKSSNNYRKNNNAGKSQTYQNKNKPTQQQIPKSNNHVDEIQEKQKYYAKCVMQSETKLGKEKTKEILDATKAIYKIEDPYSANVNQLTNLTNYFIAQVQGEITKQEGKQ